MDTSKNILKTIVLIVPYFGRLPYNFQLWLESCRYNPTVDWLMFTDDCTQYSYPDNVKVVYCTFESIKERIQSFFDFKISLDQPYKLCDYKVAYGDIFYKEIKEYDEWGICDLDVIFGNIRSFFTESILNTYDKIGFQGHLMLFKNSDENRYMYRRIIEGVLNYQEIYTAKENCFFDEDVFTRVYDFLKIPVFKEVHFAHLSMYHKDFVLGHFDKEEAYKNENQIFTWNHGCLTRYYCHQNKVCEEEFLYIHFFKRKMDIKVRNYDNIECLVIYPNKIEDFEGKITPKYIKRKAHTSGLLFDLKYLYHNLDKFSIAKVRSHLYYKRQAMRGTDR